ncbi:MAG: transporter ATP-binding protein [Ilumatobacteraceae bacterium]|nr:transporter ATP-binding protein [Ilumatobacteraceae bacterium]
MQNGGGQSLRIDHVSHHYLTGDTTLPVLDDLDVDIAAGSFVCLVGPSGCGKTTLLQLVAGFASPTSGRIAVGGKLITGPGADRGVVFQQPTSLLPWLSVRQNVELGLRLRGVNKARRRERADVELERVGLTEFADRAVYELSGGMQQRCQIARVLANDPGVMLMDEPLGALDALTREHLQTELRRIWRETARTVFLITHSVEEAVGLGSRVIVMSQRPGRAVLDEPFPFVGSDEPLDELRSRPDFVEACRRVRQAIESR